MNNNSAPKISQYYDRSNSVSPKHQNNFKRAREQEPYSTCGSAVWLREVKKNGPNHGREFYTCSCDGKSAFCWKENIDPEDPQIKCRAADELQKDNFSGLYARMDRIEEMLAEIYKIVQ